jgi:AcrR family transcriptional regulator
MSTQAATTRQRLIQAALELFVAQGVTNTTTRQIATQAEVNEVTLFRHFGNKYGLLLAVIEESSTFANLGQALTQSIDFEADIEQLLKKYASSCLHLMEQLPAFIRSVIGEADQYPPENRQALGKKLTEANRAVAQHLATAIQQGAYHSHLPPEKIAGLLNGLLFGYAVIEFTSEFHELWRDQADFLNDLEQLFLQGAVSPISVPSSNRDSVEATSGSNPLTEREVTDLPTPLVHRILQRARKLSSQDYALAYVLFAAGLSSAELAALRKPHQICDVDQHILQVTTATGVRQVTVNQWILGKRYGSYVNNPLTKWLKSRKDDSPALFLDDTEQPMSEATIEQHWQTWVEGMLTPSGEPPTIAQAQQTWCVEMLMRGMSLENLSLLTGWEIARLRPYVQRANEKIALEQAVLLDRKPGHGHTRND